MPSLPTNLYHLTHPTASCLPFLSISFPLTLLSLSNSPSSPPETNVSTPLTILSTGVKLSLGEFSHSFAVRSHIWADGIDSNAFLWVVLFRNAAHETHHTVFGCWVGCEVERGVQSTARRCHDEALVGFPGTKSEGGGGEVGACDDWVLATVETGEVWLRWGVLIEFVVTSVEIAFSAMSTLVNTKIHSSLFLEDCFERRKPGKGRRWCQLGGIRLLGQERRRLRRRRWNPDEDVDWLEDNGRFWEGVSECEANT